MRRDPSDPVIREPNDRADAIAPSRRGLLRLAGGAAALTLGTALLEGRPAARAQEVNADDLKPGQYAWYPDRAPEGFVAIIVSLPDQRCYVYRNGVRIGVSTCSTGKPGHQTPVGVFTILQKDVDHHSSIYNDASMPFTERLTWSGVALHAGGLPGYPSSHGCVHLPLEFSKLLFAVTHYGTPVIIADSHSQPVDVLHPGLVMPADATTAIQKDDPKNANGTPDKEAAPDPAQDAVAMIISGASKELTVIKDGVTAFTAPATIKDADIPLGNVVYVLKSVGGEVSWTALSFEGNGASGGKAASAIDRVTVSAAANQQLAKLLVPGSTLFITDLPATPDTRSDKDFVILSQATS
ncbi:L,D-transpeptidase [Starkeya koreensis]|uniref:L,D-transpeptidase n=1 Tax=Ancylobacter koreensis TaxID=266121 RepID=A0ABT0DPT0_9HYPH|nr:L,D-transpeptidase [Ancylobacter koreensis]MCK0209194.1 L,D-transpeptidase [Ancylobacter koreensis]